METAKKYLAGNNPAKALERLIGMLPTVAPEDEWQVHELISAAFTDICDARGAAKACFQATNTDTILRNQRRHLSNYLFTLHYLGEVDAQSLYETAKIYGTLYRDVETFTPKSHEGDKIHVAYIAPYFVDSSAARFYETLLTMYDREKFYVTAWSLSSDEDDFTKKIRRSVDGYYDVSGISFEEAAQKINESGADILYDLGGHTEGGVTLQVAGYKPARVQVSGIGYFDTTGLSAIDYYMTDKYLVRTGKRRFAEKILPVGNIFAFKPNKKMRHAKNNLIRTPHENFTFGCLNNFMKITDEYLDCVWEILDAVPNSKIIFRDTTPLESRRAALTEKIASAGFSRNRVEILCGSDDFYDDYGRIDLMLDTFPYTGGMMTALSIYMGVPVLNLRGKIHSRRLGAFMLWQAGLEYFITTNVDEYIKVAVDYAKNPTEISPYEYLFDVESFVKKAYAALERVIKRA